MLMIKYDCDDCGEVWFDLYECAVDGECPDCGKTIAASEWADAHQIWDDSIMMEEMRQNI